MGEELQGISLMNYLDGDANYKRSISNRNTEGVIIEALNAWIASVAMNKSFHADVHAGNLFVVYDGRLAFIDFGSVGRISKKTKMSLENLTRCLPRKDWRGAARALVGMGAIMGTEGGPGHRGKCPGAQRGNILGREQALARGRRQRAQAACDRTGRESAESATGRVRRGERGLDQKSGQTFEKVFREDGGRLREAGAVHRVLSHALSESDYRRVPGLLG